MEREEWRIGVHGKRGVGVMSFVVQHVQQHFVEEYDPTIGEDTYRKQAMIDDTVCLYELSELRIPGDESWGRGWADNWARSIQGCILAYSLLDRESYDEIPNIIERLLRVRDVDVLDIPLVIIETKCDLSNERQVTLEEGQNLALRYGAPFFSTSAKNRINVDEAVFELVRCLRRKRDADKLPKKKTKPAKPVKKVIPPSTIVIPQATSTLTTDIQMYLLDVAKYSDFTLLVGEKNIYVHKAVLFSRLPSFMEKIKPTDKTMDLSSLNYSAVLSIMKYLYTGKFERENISDDLYKPAIMKLEVFNLLPILKQADVVIGGFDPKFERLLNLNFLSDLKIIVREPKKVDREVFCHKMILCARSAYFRTMYHGGFKESDAAELVVDSCSYEGKNHSDNLFRLANRIWSHLAMFFLIKYYYIDVNKIEDESIVSDVLRLAHMYDEKPVVQLVESYLCGHITIENVSFVLMLCDLFSLSDLLKSACEEFISYRFKKVSKTSAFKKLKPELQKQLESAQKEGLWLIPKSDESQVLLKMLKNFTL